MLAVHPFCRPDLWSVLLSDFLGALERNKDNRHYDPFGNDVTLPTVSRSTFDAKKCRAFKTNDANNTFRSYLNFAMEADRM